jgi:hypothetical protein
MHILTFTCIYCMCKYMYVFLCILQYMHVLIPYHASLRRLEWICVHGLRANPIPVLPVNVDGTEKLDRHVHVRHVFQPLKRLLKVFSAELPVLSVGSRKMELSDPIRVIVDHEVNQLLRKITQTGKKAEHDGLGQAAGCSPRKVLHAKAKIASMPQPVAAIHSSPSLCEFQRYSARRLGAALNAAAQTIGHTFLCLLVLLALPITRREDQRSTEIGRRIGFIASGLIIRSAPLVPARSWTCHPHHVRKYKHIHTYTYIYVRIHTYTYIYIQIHAHRCPLRRI